MDSIYLTKWGSYIDLSKIAMITKGHPKGYELSVQFQLCEGVTGIDIYKNGHNLSIDQCFDDLVNAWKEYKGESNNDRKDAVKALVELGEELNSIKVAQPDLQPRL